MERENVIELIEKSGIKDAENPTNKDILKLFELESNNKLDEILFKEYFQSGVFPKVVDTLKSLASENVSKDYINSINKTIDVLNKEYEIANTEDEREKNFQRTLELYRLLKEESDDQRKWLTKLGYGVLGAGVVIGGIALGTRNKEAGKKIVEEGVKYLKG